MAKQKKQTKGKAGKTSGIFEGTAGEYAAQQQPQNFLNFKNMTSGFSAPGTDYNAWLQNEGFADVYGGYTNALGGNERLTFQDYINQVGGGGLGGQLTAGFNRFMANDQMQPHYAAQLRNQGILDTGNAGSAYEAAMLGNVFGNRQSDYYTARSADPTLGWDEWMSGVRSPLTGVMSPGTAVIEGDDGGGGGKKKGKKGKAKG